MDFRRDGLYVIGLGRCFNIIVSSCLYEKSSRLTNLERL
jgi:hypothetical protein